MIANQQIHNEYNYLIVNCDRAKQIRFYIESV